LVLILAKRTFHLVAPGENGKVLAAQEVHSVAAHHLQANLQASLIGLEACSGAYFLGRALQAQGHDVKLIPAPNRGIMAAVRGRIDGWWRTFQRK
jgi:transposase